MGMYTGLRLSVKLKEESKNIWLPVLIFMVEADHNSTKPKEAVNHPLFSNWHWTSLLQATSSYLGEFDSCSKLEESSNELFAQFNTKYHDGIIDKFLDWISVHVEILHFGCCRYEEWRSEAPIIFEDGKLQINYKQVEYDD
jgi:hypothetical protein